MTHFGWQVLVQHKHEGIFPDYWLLKNKIDYCKLKQSLCGVAACQAVTSLRLEIPTSCSSTSQCHSPVVMQ